ncbi:hypothetical protein KGV55_00260 [Candidatus Gracilibacteria bacterium]|nr:hypothetical protein [Candidatus Gracilibacteria bacterium]
MNTIRQLTIQEASAGIYQATYFFGTSAQWSLQTKSIERLISGVEALLQKELMPPNKIVKAPNTHKEHDPKLIEFVDFLEEKYISSQK